MTTSEAKDASRRTRRRVYLGLLVSFLLTAPLPLFNKTTEFGDLSNVFTDHLHHSFMTWVALHKGAEVYRVPFEQSWQGVDAKQRWAFWGEMPLNYPPGVLLVFLPLSLVGEWVELAPRTHAGLGVVWVLLFAHLAMASAYLALERVQPRWLKWLFAAFSYLILLRLGLEGFYDVVWLACAGMAVHALNRGKPDHSLLWMAAAAFFHYRAVVLIPLGIYALWLCVRGKPWRQWPWPTLAVVAAVGVICVGTFLMMYPATAGYRASGHKPVYAKGLFNEKTLTVIPASLALAAILWRRHWALAVTVIFTCAFAFIDVRAWWHASVMLVTVFGAAHFREPGTRPWEVLVLPWWILVQREIWGGDFPTALFTALAKVRF